MPDNDARQQAEEQIKGLVKDPQVVPALVHHLRPFKTSNVRQLPAVPLCKKITGHWAKLSFHVKLSVNSALSRASPSTQVSKGVSRVKPLSGRARLKRIRLSQIIVLRELDCRRLTRKGESRSYAKVHKKTKEK